MGEAKRKLTIVNREEKASGEKNGNKWTLWKVEVLDEQGQPIDAEFKCFGDPELNVLTEFEVERQEHEKYGVSYMLKGGRDSGGGGGKGGLGASVDALRDRVETLEAAVAALQGGAPSPAGANSGSQSAARPPMANAGAGPPAVAPQTSDDDIPF